MRRPRRGGGEEVKGKVGLWGDIIIFAYIVKC